MKLPKNNGMGPLKTQHHKINQPGDPSQIKKKHNRSSPNQMTSSEANLKGNKHILVIDDDQLVAEMLGNIIERIGYNVTTETNSVKAFEHFSLQPDKYDLIFSDITMPDLTGDMLTQKVLEIRADIPVILCTGFSELVDSEKAKSIGAYALVQKPFKRGEVADIIGEALNRGQTIDTVSK